MGLGLRAIDKVANKPTHRCFSGDLPPLRKVHNDGSFNIQDWHVIVNASMLRVYFWIVIHTSTVPKAASLTTDSIIQINIPSLMRQIGKI